MHTRSEKRERWEQIIWAWENSGLSQKAFCLEHGYSQHLFAYWRKVTREDNLHGNAQHINGYSTPIQLACYQISEPVATAINPEPELETTGIMVPIGSSGMVTITGRLSIGHLARIMDACTITGSDSSQQTGVVDVPA